MKFGLAQGGNGECLALKCYFGSLGASLVALMVKNLPAMGRHRFEFWVRKICWRREWLPIPVFFPGESHGQRTLEGYNPQGHKESDRTEQLTLSLSTLGSLWSGGRAERTGRPGNQERAVWRQELGPNPQSRHSRTLLCLAAAPSGPGS